MKNFIIPLHSVANIITNSSSELFLVTSDASKEEIIRTICEMYPSTEAEGSDVKITLISTIDDMKNLFQDNLHFAKKVLKIINIDCSITPIEFQPAPGVKKDLWDALSLSEQANEMLLDKFLEDNQQDIQNNFKPFLFVRAWCQDATDFPNIARDLNGIEC